MKRNQRYTAQERISEQALRRFLETYIEGYVGSVYGTCVFDLVSDDVINTLLTYTRSLSENEDFPNHRVDAINVAQQYALTVSGYYKHVDGRVKSDVRTDPESIATQLGSIAESFTLNEIYLAPTLRYEEVSYDLERSETRPANRLAAAIIRKFLDHEYFCGLEEREQQGVFGTINVNITSELLERLGVEPLEENVSSLVDTLLEKVTDAIDRDVIEINQDLSDDEDEEEATPLSIIRTHMTEDHDFLMNVVQSM